MKLWSRRSMIGAGLSMTAGPLYLSANAQPTEETEDSHNYLEYLARQEPPQLTPQGSFGPSYEDILGPYYAQNAPFRGKVTAPLEPGEILLVRGRIWSYETKRPIAHALLDIWQADAEGKYDKTDAKDRLKISQFRNRIRLLTDETGYYEYETVKPGKYRVGASYRPSHIHYLVRAPGHRQLITQLYFKGDPHNDTDATAKKSNLRVELETVSGAGGKYLRATFDLVLVAGESKEPAGAGAGAERPGTPHLKEIVVGTKV
ncbi:MAG: hypothetical protein NZV14_00020 [Bryobacteraceae bacterium]|nr:hypothetical protein [Bryobacteraceae bacterium]MDW8376516.1 hypothetical protein [Bryobacterales bacterium]